MADKISPGRRCGDEQRKAQQYEGKAPNENHVLSR